MVGGILIKMVRYEPWRTPWLVGHRAEKGDADLVTDNPPSELIHTGPVFAASSLQSLNNNHLRSIPTTKGLNKLVSGFPFPILHTPLLRISVRETYGIYRQKPITVEYGSRN